MKYLIISLVTAFLSLPLATMAAQVTAQTVPHQQAGWQHGLQPGKPEILEALKTSSSSRRHGEFGGFKWSGVPRDRKQVCGACFSSLKIIIWAILGS